ncbi:uncharacterized protein isoform X3 [Takifugu rubripes]|uniref:uncharacterized protein isoform X3 n=1 Tax=Takifugu rubripes TaxID=31033 RepID=UPI00114596D7|nr:uncharacterized protein LOC105416451 isoform X3 [Takifugu rubripes]
MGRLDAVAKKKVIELRESGLSFRKIKAVLELENIKVSAQAIYLFLKEFHGRPPGRVRPLEAGSSSSSAQIQPLAGTSQETRSNNWVQNLCREASRHGNLIVNRIFTEETSTNPEADVNLPRKIQGSSQMETQHNEDKEEKGIQIVSVTSLAQKNQQINHQSTATRAEMTSGSSALTPGAFTRRRNIPFTTNAILAARKRLLDKALSQRQTSLSIRRDQLSSLSADLRATLSQAPKTYDLPSEQTVTDRQPAENGSPRHFLATRPGPSIRSLHPLPRVGVHLPNRSPSPLASAPGVSLVRLQTPGGTVAPHTDGKQSPKQTVGDPGVRGGLQDQIQTLSSEVHGLGLAVKMLVEQQRCLEREQAQQTQIQKQILSTLQSFASKLGSCSSGQQHHNPTSSPPAVPSASIPNSFNFSEGTYTPCSQSQPSYNSLESLETVEDFKVPELNPSSMNGFPPCSSAENNPLTHASPQPQSYAAAYSRQSRQTLVPPYTQPYVSTYSEAHQTFKASDFTSSCPARALQDCSVSNQPQDPQISVIKVEGP